MKNIFLLLVILIPSICFSQNLPVQLIIHTQPLSDHSYILLMNVKIKEGWYVYAKGDTSLGIDPLTVMLGNDSFGTLDESNFNPTRIVDSLFGNKIFSVYRNDNVLEKMINIGSNSKFTVIRLTGFASNQRQIMPINICRVIDLNKAL